MSTPVHVSQLDLTELPLRKRNRRVKVDKGKPSRPLTKAEERADKLGLLVERVDRKKLYNMHKGKCGICRKRIKGRKWEIDHRIPLSKGGEHSYRNCQISHPACNRLKADKMPWEMKALMRTKRYKGPKQRYYNPHVKKPVRAVISA